MEVDEDKQHTATVRGAQGEGLLKFLAIPKMSGEVR
jgi:hypothetical protein